MNKQPNRKNSPCDVAGVNRETAVPTPVEPIDESDLDFFETSMLLLEKHREAFEELAK